MRLHLLLLPLERQLIDHGTHRDGIADEVGRDLFVDGSRGRVRLSRRDGELGGVPEQVLERGLELVALLEERASSKTYNPRRARDMATTRRRTSRTCPTALVRTMDRRM